jgi:hypothetical protein
MTVKTQPPNIRGLCFLGFGHNQLQIFAFISATQEDFLSVDVGLKLSFS